ncbi:MAG: thiamine phosphate synthase [Deltaproteobacteria bacterium]|nr:thiamine phosphate synthase [Deltaproteobacteria bacterium]
MKKTIGRLHVLTDTMLQSRFSHVQLTKCVCAGRGDTIQFRQKTGSSREMIETARKMRAICDDKGVAFIVNDRVDVAMAAKAHGVHLGQDDFPIPMARELLGDACIIGGSAATLEEAYQCVSDGADYVGFGPVYLTGSKADAGPVSGMDILRRVVKEIPLPIIAIGGIDKGNAREVMEAGAHGIAVISSVCCQEDPEEATRHLRKILEGK